MASYSYEQALGKQPYIWEEKMVVVMCRLIVMQPTQIKTRMH